MTDPNATQIPDTAHTDVIVNGDIQAGIANIGGTQVFQGDVYVQVAQGGVQPPKRKIRLFLSYARAEDNGLGEVSFVRRLYQDLTARDFEVWWDRVSMPGRGLTFLQEIRDVIDLADSLLLAMDRER
jgi:hypothetical protein